MRSQWGARAGSGWAAGMLSIALVLTGCAGPAGAPGPGGTSTGGTGPGSAGSATSGPDAGSGQPPFSLDAKGAGAGDKSAGMKVTDARSIGKRSWSLAVDTKNVDPKAARVESINLLVTLPEGFSSDRDYPVIYLLQGSESTFMQWFDSGYVEELFAGQDVILVMPEAGEAGWYSNWADSPFAQQWRDFHLIQVIPWVDRNLPTRTDREQRAVMGVSMGGYGAITYAEERPDLFGSAVSLSGLLSTENPDTTAFVRNQVKAVTGSPNDLGGAAESSDVKAEAEQQDGVGMANPLDKIQALQDTRVWVISGTGSPGEPVATGGGMEAALTDSARSFVKRAKESGVSVSENYFGASENCNADHSWGCWRTQITDLLPALMKTLTTTPRNSE